MTHAAELRIFHRLRLRPAKNKPLADVVREGLPTDKAVGFLTSLSHVVPREALIRVAGISRRTLERRNKGRLSPEQSDRVARIARIVDDATESIGTQEQALLWLSVPNQSLEGNRPVELLDTDAGTRRVEIVLGRLREGSFA
jgi:putative toxin-antitoxin system antitoxin component (TIGR02293 family)